MHRRTFLAATATTVVAAPLANAQRPAQQEPKEPKEQARKDVRAEDAKLTASTLVWNTL